MVHLIFSMPDMWRYVMVPNSNRYYLMYLLIQIIWQYCSPECMLYLKFNVYLSNRIHLILLSHVTDFVELLLLHYYYFPMLAIFFSSSSVNIMYWVSIWCFIQILRLARGLGDFLLVGIHTDHNVRYDLYFSSFLRWINLHVNLMYPVKDRYSRWEFFLELVDYKLSWMLLYQIYPEWVVTHDASHIYY